MDQDDKNSFGAFEVGTLMHNKQERPRVPLGEKYIPFVALWKTVAFLPFFPDFTVAGG